MTLNETQFGNAQSQLEYHQAHSDPDFYRLRDARRALAGHTSIKGMGAPPSLHPQGKLFDPADLPRQEAHQQMPHEFAADPRTWFHGRYMKEAQPKAPKGRSSEGFHAGTRASAVQRLQYNKQSRGVKEGMAGRIFPLRATGEFEKGFRSEPEPTKNPFRKGGGSIKHTDLAYAEKGYRYKNQVEDEGAVSIGAPQRAGYLSTHREMVAAAKTRGEHVNPIVEWAAKHHPEHTGETVFGADRRWRPREEDPQGKLFS